jgi:hypothetical protein
MLTSSYDTTNDISLVLQPVTESRYSLDTYANSVDGKDSFDRPLGKASALALCLPVCHKFSPQPTKPHCHLPAKIRRVLPPTHVTRLQSFASSPRLRVHHLPVLPRELVPKPQAFASKTAPTAVSTAANLTPSHVYATFITVNSDAIPASPSLAQLGELRGMPVSFRTPKTPQHGQAFSYYPTAQLRTTPSIDRVLRRAPLCLPPILHLPI